MDNQGNLISFREQHNLSVWLDPVNFIFKIDFILTTRTWEFYGPVQQLLDP